MKFKFFLALSLAFTSLSYAQPDLAPEVAPAESKAPPKTSPSKSRKSYKSKKKLEVSEPKIPKVETPIKDSEGKAKLNQPETPLPTLASDGIKPFASGLGIMTAFDLWDFKGLAVQPFVIYSSSATKNNRDPIDATAGGSSSANKSNIGGFGLGIVTAYALPQAPVKFLLKLQSSRLSGNYNSDVTSSAGVVSSSGSNYRFQLEDYLAQISVGPFADSLEFFIGGKTQYNGIDVSTDPDIGSSSYSFTYFSPFFGAGYHMKDTFDVRLAYYLKSDRSSDSLVAYDRIQQSMIELEGLVRLSQVTSGKLLIKQDSYSQLNYDRPLAKEDGRKDQLSYVIGPKFKFNPQSEFDFFLGYAPKASDGKTSINSENSDVLILSPKYFLNLDSMKALGFELDYTTKTGNSSSDISKKKETTTAYVARISFAVKI